MSEFNCVLSDVLEAQMEKTPVKGTYNRLFEGLIENVISCVNVDYESTRQEKFATIQLNVKGNKTIEQSFREYVAQESLDGDNQYDTGTE